MKSVYSARRGGVRTHAVVTLTWHRKMQTQTSQQIDRCIADPQILADIYEKKILDLAIYDRESVQQFIHTQSCTWRSWQADNRIHQFANLRHERHNREPSASPDPAVISQRGDGV